MLKAVVFDMDGVLFDTERISCECWYQASKELNLPMKEETIYGCFGLSAADCRTFVIRSEESSYPGGSFPYDTFREACNRLFAERLAQGVPMMEGVREILTFLKENGIKAAVASSTRYGRVMSNLKANGLVDAFEQIITGDMVEHSKPDPDIYLKACSALGVKPAEAAAVEDSPNGIRSAAAAGMFTVMVPDMVQPDEELEELYDLKCDSLLKLRDYLAESISRR